MKNMMKTLSLVMALVLLCCVFASCGGAKTLSGTYSVETGSSLAGGKVSYTFSGNRVTITTTAEVVGVATSYEAEGTYEINEATDGTQTITITIEDGADGLGSYAGTQSFAEGKDADGNKTVTIGLLTLTKTK